MNVLFRFRQDMRLHDHATPGEKVICHNEKLSSGSTVEFAKACRDFFSSTAFAKDASWPTAILASSMVDGGANLDIEVCMSYVRPSAAAGVERAAFRIWPKRCAGRCFH